MDEKRLLATLSAVIQTIAHFGVVSESIIVVFLMEQNITPLEWHVIKYHLIKEGYIRNMLGLLSITMKGKKMDKEITNAMEPKKDE